MSLIIFLIFLLASTTCTSTTAELTVPVNKTCSTYQLHYIHQPHLDIFFTTLVAASNSTNFYKTIVTTIPTSVSGFYQCSANITTTVVNNSLFRSLFEKQKLTGNNFLEWYRNLRIVLSTEDKLPFLEQPIPVLPVPPQGQANPPDVITTHQAWVKAQKEIVRLMLMTMDPKIQKTLVHLGAYDMLKELQSLILCAECLQDRQIQDSIALPTEVSPGCETRRRGISVCSVMSSKIKRKEYKGFIQNYNMHSMGKTVNELHAMLKLHEQTLPPKEVAPALHAIRAWRIQKNQKKKSHKAAKGNQRKGKAKMGYAPVQAPPFAPKPKNPPAPKKDNPAKDAICHQCDGFINRFEKDNSISVFKNNMIYFNAIPRDDIYEIVMSSSNTNECSMYAVTNKSTKLNLDSALLWHCRLGHINKKRIEMLQHDGLLNSTDIKFFEKCVSCMSRKMARKPYSHQVERAKDLLGLIHTDVCGLFKIMSRQGAYYFVTFTDDFSRYGYVYLLKYKHEVFETFIVFQKEVENQLGKTIKSLRSDRGGEYMSQEFLDHLTDHGIIVTPPK
ncbi:retrotransposon protein, putative, ty1-copia subclass [Tanacetum coccineum]